MWMYKLGVEGLGGWYGVVESLSILSVEIRGWMRELV